MELQKKNCENCFLEATKRRSVTGTIFEWQIPNFADKLQDQGGYESCISPKFIRLGKQWTLKLSLKNNKDKNLDHLNLSLHWNPCYGKNMSSIEVDYTMYLLTSNDLHYKQHEGTYIFKKLDTKGHGFIIGSKNRILEHARNILPGGVLTVCCIISKVTHETNEHENDFKNNLKIAFDEQKHGDITFEFDDGKKIVASKLILASQSPVFAAMFEPKTMIEGESGHVKISTFTHTSFFAMIKYIHCQEMPSFDKVNCREILDLSEQYQLPILKESCFKELEEKLDLENSFETYYLTVQYNADNIKLQVLSFLKKNIFNILRLDLLSKIEDPQVLLLSAKALEEASKLE